MRKRRTTWIPGEDKAAGYDEATSVWKPRMAGTWPRSLATRGAPRSGQAVAPVGPATKSGWTGQAEQSPNLSKLMTFDFAKLV